MPRTLHTQQYLRKFKHDLSEVIFEKMKESYDIKVNSDQDLKQFTYGPKSPKCDLMCQECRGLILTTHSDKDHPGNLPKSSWDVVCYPFRRFFNPHEGPADDINFKRATLTEKRDGSLILLYHYGGHWRVATRGRVDASGGVPGSNDLTFKDLFWKTLIDQGGDLRSLSPLCNVFFELTGPLNKIITPYRKSELRIIGARDRGTFDEVDYRGLNRISSLINIPIVDRIEFEDEEEIYGKLKELEDREEGFVLTDYCTRKNDGSFPRIKIKNPAYLKWSKTFGNQIFTKKNAVEVAMNCDLDKFGEIFPEYKERVRKTHEEIEELKMKIREDFGEYKYLAKESRKEFALKVKDKSYSWMLFALLDKKFNSVEEAINSAKPEKILKMLKKHEED